MSDTPLTDAANRHAKELATVKAEKPSAFTVGLHTDGQGVVATATYDRTWKNGWGATAYAKAWWNDASVTPVRSSGVAAGAEGRYEFGDNE